MQACRQPTVSPGPVPLMFPMKVGTPVHVGDQFLMSPSSPQQKICVAVVPQVEYPPAAMDVKVNGPFGVMPNAGLGGATGPDVIVVEAPGCTPT